jgi:hypothetical protein
MTVKAQILKKIQQMKCDFKTLGVVDFTLRSGDLGKIYGFYNKSSNGSLPGVCHGMKAAMLKDDRIIGPPSGMGANVYVCYKI